MYRFWAPWDATGVRDDLKALVASGRVSPATHPEVLDLGCGTGANVVYLAGQGFTPTGVDFSPVALRQAHDRAVAAGRGEDCRFVQADLTDPDLPDRLGAFDLLLDFGTLDDLDSAGRAAMAHNLAELARPGALVLFFCFHAPRGQLPVFSLSGPSRLAPGLEPGEPERLLGGAFAIEAFRDELDRGPTACFLLTRRGA